MVDVLKGGRAEVVVWLQFLPMVFLFADEAFKLAGIPLKTLTNYPTLIDLAIEKGHCNCKPTKNIVKLEQQPGRLG